MFSFREFQTALQKARNAHPNISDELSESVMKKFVERWENNRSKPKHERENFGELIRFTLNELCISGKNKRQMYAAMIGHYYSAHAAYRKSKKNQTDSVKPVVKKPYGVTRASNGQLSWQL